jgi:nitrogen regulatory protein P-II 1
MIVVISAIVKPHRVEAVRRALGDAGVTGITVSEVRGFGRQGGHTEVYRGAEYRIDLVPKMRVDVLVADGDGGRVVDAITAAAHTGKIGDGKIWVAPAGGVELIDTGERGDDAL